VIDLYTAPTPNGWKASIALEELAIPYEVHVVNLMAGDQKQPDYRLAEHEWLAGDYSIADIANWSWVRTYKWSAVSVGGLAPLQRWLDQMKARPACQRGADVPFRLPDLTEEATTEQAQEFAKGARTMLQR